ncbi:hypothetical protein HAX54_005065 [Datura stramonium]|uniref:VPS37 C-terminal domain-containing protein n=1 Tax=Datura stramonium TaxID=4076 RepID=A0ABS8WVP1_DATST|nr:hypothetical protein [Datura stramonium]
MFKFWGAEEQQAQPSPQEASNASWYSPSVVSSPSSSRPATPCSSSSGSLNGQSPTNRPSSMSHVSPAEAADIIAALKNKSVNELKKLHSDKDAYRNFLHSLEAVKTQNNVRDELLNETLQLARENLEKEPWIMELRNQCRIIRTTELAAAQEKMHELERRKEELLKLYSPVSLLHQLQDAMKKAEEESEALLAYLGTSRSDNTPISCRDLGMPRSIENHWQSLGAHLFRERILYKVSSADQSMRIYQSPPVFPSQANSQTALFYHGMPYSLFNNIDNVSF